MTSTSRDFLRTHSQQSRKISSLKSHKVFLKRPFLTRIRYFTSVKVKIMCNQIEALCLQNDIEEKLKRKIHLCNGSFFVSHACNRMSDELCEVVGIGVHEHLLLNTGALHIDEKYGLQYLICHLLLVFAQNHIQYQIF